MNMISTGSAGGGSGQPGRKPHTAAKADRMPKTPKIPAPQPQSWWQRVAAADQAAADADWLGGASTMRALRPRLAAHGLMLMMVGFFAWAGIWAGYARLDEVAKGEGQVIPSQEIQNVQSLEGGILSELMVADGDHVQRGQLLAKIDGVLFAAEQRGNLAKIDGLKAAITRLEAEANGTTPQFNLKAGSNNNEFIAAQQKLFQDRANDLETSLNVMREDIKQINHQIAEVEARIVQLSNNAVLIKRELDLTSKLVDQHVVSEVEKIRLEQKLNDSTGELKASKEVLQRLQSSLVGSQSKIEERVSQFRVAARDELNQRQVELASLREAEAPLNDRLRRAELRSPVEGDIKSIAVKTIGGVITPAMDLIQIVPSEDDLKIRARIKPADVGFLHPGQTVRIKITAYDYRIYGSLPGTLERIGADTVTTEDGQRFYEIDVRTDHAAMKGQKADMRIIPGMVAEVDVITGSRTVLNYLLKPLHRVRERAMTEP